MPSNRKFGWFFVAIFTVVATYLFLKDEFSLAILVILVAIVLATVTVFCSQLLTPFNRLWFGLGLLLGTIVSPIVLGIIFFALITPVSLVTRLFGRDVLLKKKSSVTSYWIDRDPIGPAPDSFKKQF